MGDAQQRQKALGAAGWLYVGVPAPSKQSTGERRMLDKSIHVQVQEERPSKLALSDKQWPKSSDVLGSQSQGDNVDVRSNKSKIDQQEDQALRTTREWGARNTGCGLGSSEKRESVRV